MAHTLIVSCSQYMIPSFSSLWRPRNFCVPTRNLLSFYILESVEVAAMPLAFYRMQSQTRSLSMTRTRSFSCKLMTMFCTILLPNLFPILVAAGFCESGTLQVGHAACRCKLIAQVGHILASILTSQPEASQRKNRGRHLAWRRSEKSVRSVKKRVRKKNAFAKTQ